jgi:hypothetical protein
MRIGAGACARGGLPCAALVGVAALGTLALRPVRPPDVDARPILRRAENLRQAVARDPRNARLHLQLARAELAGAQAMALLDYSARYPETLAESPDEARARYDAWQMGYLHVSPAAARAIAHARTAAALAPTQAQQAEALVVAGSAAWQRGDERGGLAFFRAACRARPAWRPAWVRLAAAAASRGDEPLYREAHRHLLPRGIPETDTSPAFEHPRPEKQAGPRSPTRAAASRAPSGSAAASAARSTERRSGTPPYPSADS